jgi:periplasmic divalent cation tolerance protein
MSEFVQITTTTGTRHDAERIATELVARRLAACVQIGGPIQSTFRWQGAVENTEEWVCTAKTSRSRLAAIEAIVKELHPYEMPELIATDIVGGSAAYLQWVAEQVSAAEPNG